VDQFGKELLSSTVQFSFSNQDGETQQTILAITLSPSVRVTRAATRLRATKRLVFASTEILLGNPFIDPVSLAIVMSMQSDLVVPG